MHAIEPAKISGGAVDAPGAPLDFTLGEALDTGWRGVREHGLTLVVAHVLAALPGAAAGAALRFGFGELRFGSREYWLRAAAGFACGEVFAALFRTGLIRMAIAAARGATPELRDLVRGASGFGPMLLLEAMSTLLGIASAPLLWIPYAYVWLGLAPAAFFYADRPELGLRGALRASWEAARGERLHLLGFYVAAEVVTYLGLVVCCVGTLVAVPLASVATAHVYLRLAGERVARADENE